MSIKFKYIRDPTLDRRFKRTDRRWKFRSAAYVRTAAKRSMRKRKGVAPAGQPPSRHQGGLARGLRFVVPDSGPAVVYVEKRYGQGGGRHVHSPIGRLTEFGGATMVTYREARRSELRNYKRRPFLNPALRNAQGQLSQFYAEAWNQF